MLRTTILCLARSGMVAPTLLARKTSSGDGGSNQYQNFADILAQSQQQQHQSSSQGIFDGNFNSGQFMDASAISAMQQSLQRSLTPEMRESMAAMMQSALQRGDGMPGGQVGMMAFGMGENEKGKKVARAAKLSYDLKTGKVNKDFMEQQIEPDDMQLPKDTVEDYGTEGAMEVDFIDPNAEQLKGEKIVQEEIEVEFVNKEDK